MKKPIEYLDQISDDSLKSKLTTEEYLEWLKDLRGDLEIRIEMVEHDNDPLKLNNYE